MQPRYELALRHAAGAGLLIFVLAAIGFGLALPGYSQIDHLLDVLGATGMPRANTYNLFGLMLPGLLAGAAALRLRQRLPPGAGWPVRIGAQLVFLSTLGLVAFGLLPVDPADLHNAASSYHATAWMLWWVAFVPGALLLAWGLRGQAGWRRVGTLAMAAALVLLVIVLVGVELLPSGLAQRLGFLIWWGWLLLASWSGNSGQTASPEPR